MARSRQPKRPRPGDLEPAPETRVLYESLVPGAQADRASPDRASRVPGTPPLVGRDNERARLAGGTVSISTELTKGTRVQVDVPLHCDTLRMDGSGSAEEIAQV